MKRYLAVVFMVLITLGFFATQGDALTMHSDRTSWEASVGSYEGVDIAGQVPYGTTLAAGSALTLPYAEYVTFDISLSGRQVPTSWATWSGGETPAVLYTGGAQSVTGTFGPGGVSAFGLEMEPNPFQTFSMMLTLTDGTALSQPVDGYAGAKFFGWSSGDVASMTLFCDGCDFAFGRMVKAEPVPEPTTLILLGAGLVGLAFARRKMS